MTTTPRYTKTAHIIVKRTQTDPESQSVLVNDNGEFWHNDEMKWCSLPKKWEQKAQEALSSSDEATK
jgi:hypothetical protein